MPDKKDPKDLEEALFNYTRKALFKPKGRTLEEAFEEALELKPKKEEETEDDQWI
jgi:hypothetical protein